MAEDKKNPLGPTGDQVRSNVERIREARGLTKKELADRAAALGRPIPPLGISRIEAGTRRVDADDLTALAVALNVSPLSLLLPPNDGRDQHIKLTPETVTTLTGAWKWASGAHALPDEPGEEPNQEKQEAYERLSHSARQRYAKRNPAGRAVDVLHDEVLRLVEISGTSTEQLDEEFERRLDNVRAWINRLAAEVDRAASEHAELSRWAKLPQEERRQGTEEGDRG